MPIPDDVVRSFLSLGKVVQRWALDLTGNVDTLDSDKADKVSGATAGNFASLDSDGNLADSGHKDADYADAVHTHDDRYYTEAEVLAAFAAVAHTHDDRYYTEAEAVALFAAALHTHSYEPLVTPVDYQASPTAETLRDALIELGFMDAAPAAIPPSADEHFDTAGDEHFDTSGDEHFDNE